MCVSITFVSVKNYIKHTLIFKVKSMGYTTIINVMLVYREFQEMAVSPLRIICT